MNSIQYVLGLGLLVAGALALAHETIASNTIASNTIASNNVVPQAEQERALQKGFAGPAENRGVTSVTPVGLVPLGWVASLTACRAACCVRVKL